MNDSTIVALATPKLKSAIAIIRMSGDQSSQIINEIFSKKINKKENNRFYYGIISDGENIIDEVVILFYKNPNSFTGEDLVEINCHGSIFVIEQIIKLLINKGARYAKPGEFTFRAFINRKINLIKAESINNLVNSYNKISHEQSINNLLGMSTSVIKKIQKNLLDIIANIEVNIDYPEYDADTIMPEKIIKFLKETNNNLKDILKNSIISKKIISGLNIAIIGEPNSGKSSLLNTFLSEDKAIISSIKGTTRDVVEGEILLDNIKINLYDTAGIRKTSNDVEKKGITKSYNKMHSSDIIINLIPPGKKSILNKKHINKDQSLINVYSKSDINDNISDININISSKNGDIKNLIEKIRDIIKNKFFINKTEVFNTNRQIEIIKNIIDKIESIINKKYFIEGIEILSIDLNDIYYKFNELVGEKTDDNILDNLFSQYCLGK